MACFEVADPEARISELVEAIDVVRHSPLIGRPVRGGMRELVIGRDARGYVALYRYVGTADAVFVLAIRGQREGRHKRWR